MPDWTPGPWHVSEADPTCVYGGASREADPVAPLIAKTDSGFWVRGRDECLANAKLIAAAPDLEAENARLRAEVARLEGEWMQAIERWSDAVVDGDERVDQARRAAVEECAKEAEASAGYCTREGFLSEASVAHSIARRIRALCPDRAPEEAGG